MNRSSRLDVSSIRVLRPARLDPYYAVEDAWVDVRFVPEADLIARDRVGPLSARSGPSACMATRS
jgi:hypothetical protein